MILLTSRRVRVLLVSGFRCGNWSRIPILVAAICTVTIVSGQEPTPRTSGDAAKAPIESSKSAPHSLDGAKLPSGAVIVVTDKPADALRNVNAVVISAGEYKRLLEAAEQTRRGVADRAEPPSACHLSGRIELRGATEMAVIRAEFRIRTTTPHASIPLGLQNAKPTAAVLDGDKPAVLMSNKDGDGYAIRIDTAGDHRVRVDLEVPVAVRGSKGGERGFELGLPGAAITTLDKLEVPAAVYRVRVAGRPVPANLLSPAEGAGPAVVLGPQPRLDIAWDAPARVTGEPPQIAAEGRIEVRVDEKAVTTRARLTLKVLRGVASVWQIRAPATAVVTPEEAAGADGSVRVERPTDRVRPTWIIRRDPSGDDLPVEITLRTPLTKWDAIRIPAFPVVDAVRQRGTLVIGAAPNLRLTLRPLDLTRRESPDDAARDAVFEYWSLPASGSPLEVDIQAVRGEVEAQLSQQFTLAERGWRWQGKLDLRPVRTEVHAVELDVPDELKELHATSAEVVEAITPGRALRPGRKLFRVQLADARRRPTTINLEGIYTHAVGSNSASLPLPRPLGVSDRGGSLTVTAPPGLEVRGTFRDWDGEQVGITERPVDPAPRGSVGLMAATDRAPARLDLAWRAPRNDVAVKSVVEIHLHERQGVVRQHWRIPAGTETSRPIPARAAAALAGRLRAVGGGTLTPIAGGEWHVQLAAATGPEHELVVAYSFPRSASSDRAGTDVPLVWLDPFPRIETEVHMWAAATVGSVAFPQLAGGPWTELPPTPVADQPTLPALSLFGSGSGLPLRLRVETSTPGPGRRPTIEKVWGQVVEDEDGGRAYRVRYRFGPIRADTIDVELPAPPESIQFAAALNQRRLPLSLKDASAGLSEGRVRLRVDASGNGPQVLELTYVLPPGGSGEASRWTWELRPPGLPGVDVGPARWQIARASGDLLFALDSFDVAERWRWQRGLFAAGPAWGTEELERWFGRADRSAGEAAGGDDVVVGRQTAPGRILFVVIPRPLAALAASLTVIALGLATIRWGGPRTGTVFAGGFVAAIAIAAVVWPRLAAHLLAASQPGVAVFLCVLAVRSALLHRYRRRVLFLPGFARPPLHGSSGVRASVNVRPRVEPSTIDVPASS
jgi:hypothetical protein